MLGKARSSRERQAEYRGYAIASILSRDAFGYFAGGLVLLLLWEAQFRITNKLSEVLSATESGENTFVFVLIAALSLSYPLGRIAYAAGKSLAALASRIGRVKPRLNVDALYEKAFADLKESIPSIKAIRPLGLTPSSGNARTVFDRLGVWWVLVNRPDLYYTAVTRTNTLRILAETSVGIFAIGGTSIVLWCLDFGKKIEIDVPNWVISFQAIIAGLATIAAVVIGLVYLAYARKFQVEAEIVGSLLVFSQFPLEMQDQPKGPQLPEGRIAVIGWGSLIPSPGPLTLDSDWRQGGPILPIEFSRVSEDRRLTLVLDRKNGWAVGTWFALSAKDAIEEAVADLARRERTTPSSVGFVDIESGEDSRSQQPEHVDIHWQVRDWCLKKGFKGAIWTALPADFEEKTGTPFSPSAARDWVYNLPDEQKSRALEYIRRAPATTHTLVRELFEE